jgi:hypothetical protein
MPEKSVGRINAARLPLSPAKNQIFIYRDPKHPSHLLLPVIPDAPEIERVTSPLCDAVPGALGFTE